MYKDSTDQSMWYFFAAAGLNISQKVLLAMLEEGSELESMLVDHFEVLVKAAAAGKREGGVALEIIKETNPVIKR